MIILEFIGALVVSAVIMLGIAKLVDIFTAPASNKDKEN